MGIFGAIKKIGKGLLGGGGQSAYSSPYLPQEENALHQGLSNRLGATQIANPNYKAGSDKPGEQRYNYDYSNTGNQVTGVNTGNTYNAGNQSVDYGDINQAIQGFKNPSQLTQSYDSQYRPTLFNQTYQAANYNPYQFNFQGLPAQYSNQQYQLGSQGINNATRGNIAQAQEAIGVRRPGLLLKASQNAQRDAGQQLANMRTQYGINQANQNAEYGKAQQLAQAGENQFGANFNANQAQNAYQSQADLAKFHEAQGQFGAGEGYKGYQSRSDLEKNNAENAYRNNVALNESAQNKINSQQDVLSGEREYQDKALQYLAQLYGNQVGAQNNAAQANNAQSQQKRTNVLGTAAKIGSMFF